MSGLRLTARLHDLVSLVERKGLHGFALTYLGVTKQWVAGVRRADGIGPTVQRVQLTAALLDLLAQVEKLPDVPGWQPSSTPRPEPTRVPGSGVVRRR